MNKECCQSHHNMVYDAEMNGYSCNVCGSTYNEEDLDVRCNHCGKKVEIKYGHGFCCDDIVTDGALPSIKETAIKLQFMANAELLGVPQGKWFEFVDYCVKLTQKDLLPGESVCPHCDHIFHVSCGCCSIVGTDLVEAVVNDIEQMSKEPTLEECINVLQRIKHALMFNDRTNYPVEYDSEEERLQMEAIEKELKL